MADSIPYSLRCLAVFQTTVSVPPHSGFHQLGTDVSGGITQDRSAIVAAGREEEGIHEVGIGIDGFGEAVAGLVHDVDVRGDAAGGEFLAQGAFVSAGRDGAGGGHDADGERRFIPLEVQFVQ